MDHAARVMGRVERMDCGRRVDQRTDQQPELGTARSAGRFGSTHGVSPQRLSKKPVQPCGVTT